MTSWHISICLVALIAIGQTSCSTLPSQGPSAIEVNNESLKTQTDVQAGYIVVDLDQRVDGILRTKLVNTFKGRFGDYRPAPNQVIGVGDTLTVTIWEAAAGGLFSSPMIDRASPGSHTAVIPNQLVDRDGSITVPYAGRIRVIGMTPPMVEQKIVSALAGKAIEPQAVVSISNNLSNTVTISGEAAANARVPLSPRGDRILDVISAAGGIRAAVHDTFITLSRDGHTVTVPMQALTLHPEENIYVRAGDTLTVVGEPQTFSVFGATGRNAVVNFDAKGITLEEAVAKSGGLVDALSDPSGVFLMRVEPVAMAVQLDPTYKPSPGQKFVNVVYRINLRDPNTYFLARKFRIETKDIIYVASAISTELQKFLALTQSAATTVYAAKLGGIY